MSKQSSDETQVYSDTTFPIGIGVSQLIEHLKTLPDGARVKNFNSDGLRLKLIGPPEAEVRRLLRNSGRGGMLDQGDPEFFVIVQEAE